MNNEINVEELPMEIIDIEPINDYISKCNIKVMYHGFNRNGGYFSKPVAEEMANSLPGVPIVAKFNEEISDFGSHEEALEIGPEGIRIVKQTVPYGSVDPYTSAVWKKYRDEDGEIREYLVVTGYLWTGRYPELKNIINNPKGQSMELYPESVKGFWAKPDNYDEEVFIYSEADISALCILGDNVTPCFEGANVEIPSVMYALDEEGFKQEFNSFMRDLKHALDSENLDKGGNDLTIKNYSLEEVTAALEKVEVSMLQEDFAVAEEMIARLEEGEDKTSFSERLSKIEVIETPQINHEEGDGEGDDSGDVADESEDVIDSSNEEPEEEEEEIEEPEEEPEPEESVIEDNTDDGAKKRELEFEALKENFELLQTQFNEVNEKYNILLEEKTNHELKLKEEVCDKFAVLGEEVIEEFKSHLNDYSVEELDKELSVLAFKKGLTFNLIEDSSNVLVTRNPEAVFNQKAPAWVEAIRKQENK